MIFRVHTHTARTGIHAGTYARRGLLFVTPRVSWVVGRDVRGAQQEGKQGWKPGRTLHAAGAPHVAQSSSERRLVSRCAAQVNNNPGRSQGFTGARNKTSSRLLFGSCP